MENKRGWVKIVEAVLGIVIIASVLVVVVSNNNERVDISESVEIVQEDVLEEISVNETLREEVLSVGLDGNFKNEIVLEDYASSKVPSYFGFAIYVCALESSESLVPCALNEAEVLDKEIYVDEVYVAAQDEKFSPRRVRLFLWVE